MRAVRIHAKQDMRTEQVPSPEPDVGEVRLRVGYVGICGSDLHLYEPLAPFMGVGDILGHENMGQVVEVGSAVTDLKVGDRVAIPFQISCGHCWMCDQQLYTQCETTQVHDHDKGAALGELDSLVVHLRDPAAPITVSAPPRLGDVDELLAAPLRHHGVVVDVRLEPDLRLDDVVELTAYRIVQESLTNIVRHARAGRAWVELTGSGAGVRVRVSDDGVGPPSGPTRGAGLTGIGERVSALSGEWDIRERPGGGTVVDVLLPDRAAGRLR